MEKVDFCLKDDDRDCSGIMEIYRGRKRAIKSKGVQGIIVKKLMKDSFRFSNYCRKRKRACKSQVVAGDITIKKPKLVDVGHRFILRKRERESPYLLLEDSESDSRVLNFESASDYSDKKQGIEESLARICDCGRFDDYEKLEEIGLGTYGTVYVARHTRTDEMVAMKEQFDGMSVATRREIDILGSLPPHPNVVEFKEVVADDSDGVYVVMEHVEYDLHRYMEAWVLSAADIKFIMRQLLQGVKFLHDNNVMHRDLKPSNILVSSEGELKICDFGLSRRMDAAAGLYEPYVGTGWYRAPEVLRGAKAYSEVVDMWGVGCIMAEMFLRSGGGDAEARHRLEKIGRIVEDGEGSEKANEQLRSKFFPATLVIGVGFDLLSRLLNWDPSKRITAESALGHVWFEEEEESS